MILWEYIKERMMQHPKQIICENDATMTYEETVIYAEILAKKLKGLDCLAILCRSEMMTAISILGCIAAGVTALPLSWRYGNKHCHKIISHIKPNAIISDANSKLEITKIIESKYVTPKVHPAFIMCTSGTTGIPKGVMLSENNILSNVLNISNYFLIDEKDRILITRPLYHCAALTGEFLTSLNKGVGIFFYSDSFNPMAFLSLIEKYEITTICATPTIFNLMARIKNNNILKKIRNICISGECMSVNTGHLIDKTFSNSSIYHVYGLTEASPRVSYLPPEYFAKYPDFVGLPLNSTSIEIRKVNNSKASIGEKGILYVKSDSVMIGYYNDLNQTEMKLKDGWLCTGDIAIIGNNGFLKILGRKDDLIIKAGMNIYPQEIESALKSDSRVKEVLAYPIKNIYEEVQIGIKVCGDFNSCEEVKSLCNTLLPIFQRPSKIELVAEIPKNTSGKIIRRKTHD